MAALLLVAALQAWADPERVAAAVDAVYRSCFRRLVLRGVEVELRMPFAEAGARRVVGGGKADPGTLWAVAERAIAQRYGGAAPDAAEEIATWLTVELGIGLDCSGFVWLALKGAARPAGTDLDRWASSRVRAPPGAAVPLYIGSGFFDPARGNFEEVRDDPLSLAPGDVIVFRGADGEVEHVAVIQSVDLARGLVRYLQSTDLAPPAERGVHESFIAFDPAVPAASIRDPAVRWSQRVEAASPGEPAPPFADDGERYRGWGAGPGGCVVRLAALHPGLRRLPLRRAAVAE